MTNEIDLTFGTCYMCGKEMADTIEGLGRAYHSSCAKCPDCGSNFVIWENSRRPIIFRCLNCLKRWQIG